MFTAGFFAAAAAVAAVPPPAPLARGLLTRMVGASRLARIRALGVGDRDGFIGALRWWWLRWWLCLEGEVLIISDEETRDVSLLTGDFAYGCARFFGDTERGRGGLCW